MGWRDLVRGDLHPPACRSHPVSSMRTLPTPGSSRAAVARRTLPPRPCPEPGGRAGRRAVVPRVARAAAAAALSAPAARWPRVEPSAGRAGRSPATPPRIRTAGMENHRAAVAAPADTATLMGGSSCCWVSWRSCAGTISAGRSRRCPPTTRPRRPPDRGGNCIPTSWPRSDARRRCRRPCHPRHHRSPPRSADRFRTGSWRERPARHRCP